MVQCKTLELIVDKARRNNSTHERRIMIIAGSNGAGKTTFAREFLPKEAGCPVFVNADLIAAGLAPFDPATAAIRAGRLMIEEMVDTWVLYDNSGDAPVFVDAGGSP